MTESVLTIFGLPATIPPDCIDCTIMIPMVTVYIDTPTNPVPMESHSPLTTLKPRNEDMIQATRRIVKIIAEKNRINTMCDIKPVGMGNEGICLVTASNYFFLSLPGDKI